MKKKIIIIVGAFFMIALLTMAQAGLLSNLFDSIKTKINPENKQILKDEIGVGKLPNINITYSYSDDEVKWSVYIPNIMNSQDNILLRYKINCIDYDYDEFECITSVRTNYTKNELADQISDEIAKRLNAYAESIKPDEFGIEEVEVVILE